jgi:hypothetical protein
MYLKGLGEESERRKDRRKWGEQERKIGSTRTVGEQVPVAAAILATQEADIRRIEV